MLLLAGAACCSLVIAPHSDFISPLLRFPTTTKITTTAKVQSNEFQKVYKNKNNNKRLKTTEHVNT